LHREEIPLREAPARSLGEVARRAAPWHIASVRLSRSRVLLRVSLLSVGGAFMLWRAVEAWRASAALDGAASALQQRVALVEALIGVLALLTAGGAALSLRKRRRRASLQLGRPADGEGHQGATRQ
jgi:hypothetical protein